MSHTENFIAKFNYYSTCKESGTIGNSYVEAMQSIIDIYGHVVEKGLVLPEEIEDFENTLSCVDYLDNKHPGIEQLPNYFSNVIGYSKKMTEEHQKVA